jgi:hypothetical protein
MMCSVQVRPLAVLVVDSSSTWSSSPCTSSRSRRSPGTFVATFMVSFTRLWGGLMSGESASAASSLKSAWWRSDFLSDVRKLPEISELRALGRAVCGEIRFESVKFHKGVVRSCRVFDQHTRSVTTGRGRCGLRQNTRINCSCACGPSDAGSIENLLARTHRAISWSGAKTAT